jgi:regulator of replication initiation timing
MSAKIRRVTRAACVRFTGESEPTFDAGRHQANYKNTLFSKGDRQMATKSRQDLLEENRILREENEILQDRLDRAADAITGDDEDEEDEEDDE